MTKHYTVTLLFLLLVVICKMEVQASLSEGVRPLASNGFFHVQILSNCSDIDSCSAGGVGGVGGGADIDGSDGNGDDAEKEIKELIKYFHKFKIRYTISYPLGNREEINEAVEIPGDTKQLKKSRVIDAFLNNEEQVESVEEIVTTQEGKKSKFELRLIYAENDNWKHQFYDTYLPNYRHENTVMEGRSLASSLSVPFRYHNHQQLTQMLQSISLQYSNISRHFSIGKSVQGRQIWVMQLSHFIHDSERLSRLPAVKYVANMHGDETLGRELMIHLIDLFCSQYDADYNDRIEDIDNPTLSQRLNHLLRSTNIFIVPSMNPDGFENLKRENANGVDLNRNFPDQFISNIADENRQEETKTIMQWLNTENFVLSANFHGGALVASYPFDGSPDYTNTYSASPDDALFKHLALTYSKAHGTMYNQGSFLRGITNGARWYALYGGMQDWNYLWHNVFEITLELSFIKNPPESALQSHWIENRESLISYLEQIYCGVSGVVTDNSTGRYLNATIIVEGINHVVESKPSYHGLYFRLLAPGNYTIYAKKANFTDSDKVHISIVSGQRNLVLVNFTLVPGDISTNGASSPFPYHSLITSHSPFINKHILLHIIFIIMSFTLAQFN